MTSINHSKRSALTLNLHSESSCKRTKFSPGALGSAVLSSPDVKKFQLTTPEIENFILNHHPNILQTPTANAANPILFPKSLPDDQELYHQTEFVDLSEYTSDSSRIQVELPKSSSSSNSSINNFMNLDPQYPPLSSNYSMTMSPSDGNVVVKEEPQTVPSLGSTPPLSPINMESQERIKLERKRMRNRVAASKCRKRKLERIAKLEDKVKILKGENSELGQIVIRLKEEVCSLKQRVMKHVDHGCKMIVANF